MPSPQSATQPESEVLPRKQEIIDHTKKTQSAERVKLSYASYPHDNTKTVIEYNQPQRANEKSSTSIQQSIAQPSFALPGEQYPAGQAPPMANEDICKTWEALVKPGPDLDPDWK